MSVCKLKVLCLRNKCIQSRRRSKVASMQVGGPIVSRLSENIQREDDDEMCEEIWK